MCAPATDSQVWIVQTGRIIAILRDLALQRRRSRLQPGFEHLTGDPVSVKEQLARGKIDVILHGSKLRGGFTLLKTKQRSTSRQQARQWLLVKHRDEYADPSWDMTIPRSIAPF